MCRNSAVRSLRIDALPSCGSTEQEQELMRQPGYNIMSSAVVTTVGQYTLLIAILFLVAFVALLLVVRETERGRHLIASLLLFFPLKNSLRQMLCRQLCRFHLNVDHTKCLITNLKDVHTPHSPHYVLQNC